MTAAEMTSAEAHELNRGKDEGLNRVVSEASPLRPDHPVVDILRGTDAPPSRRRRDPLREAS